MATNQQNISVPMTSYSKGLAKTAIYAGWQPERISGKNKDIMVFVEVKNDPTKIVTPDMMKQGKLQFSVLPIDTTLVGMLPMKQHGILAEMVLKPVFEMKEQFGPNGQKNLDKAFESFVLGQFDKTQEYLQKACMGNSNYAKKVESNLNFLEKIAPLTVEEQIVAKSQQRVEKPAKAKIDMPKVAL